MNNVRIFYIKHHGADELSQVSKRQVEQWLSELSLLKRAAVNRLLHHGDRMASLLATRLLLMCAKHENIENFSLNDILYPENGKPHWNDDKRFFDFNISHSNEMIVVSASETVDVGVDVEKIRELKRLTFKMVMSADELKKIEKTPRLFFKLWSQKEAVVKAASTTGISRMRDICLEYDRAVLDGKKWYLSELNLDEQYITYLATSKPVDKVIIEQVSINDLYS